ncbi:MAG: transglutaminase family protein [Chromatiales bacterium]
MRTPPALLAAVLLFWGWHTATLIIAVPLALLAELWRLTPLRWDLNERDFQRLSDLTSVLFVALVLYQFNEHVLTGIFHVLKWLPATLFLLLIAQLYSRRGAMPLSALFASMRRREGSALAAARRDVDLSYPYVLVCLAAASVGDRRSTVFFAVTALLLVWALWPWRPQRYHAAVWGALLAVALSLGFTLQHGLQTAQGVVGTWLLHWLQDPSIGAVSPDRAFTAIGMVGRLKLSDRIRLRVRPEQPLQAPLLLREASYSQYLNGTWRNRAVGFTAIERQPAQSGWPLAPPRGHNQRLSVSAPLKYEVDVIPLPHGARTVYGLAILGVQQHPYGTVMVDAKPGYLEYQVDYDAGALAEPPPSAQDLEVPAGYAAVLTRVSTELRPGSGSTADKVAATEKFFRGSFTYSLVQRNRPPWSHPLRDFLLHRRSGHCEYFATATVLLLRQLGVAARYAVGYSVSEYSALEGQYIARQRDAHAWALAYVRGAWRIVDTTPAIWHEEEEAVAGPLSALSDLIAWAGYHWSRWRTGEQAWRSQLPWLLLPLTLWLLWRLRHTRRAARATRPASAVCKPLLGADSEFYALIDRLQRSGEGPLAGETLQAWVHRLGQRQHREYPRLCSLIELHYRLRFDPHGLDAPQRAALRAAAAAK